MQKTAKATANISARATGMGFFSPLFNSRLVQTVPLSTRRHTCFPTSVHIGAPISTHQKEFEPLLYALA
jgi:hypothetical protein